MNQAEYKKLSPKKRKEFLASFDAQVPAHQQVIDEKNGLISKLTEENKTQIDEREAARKACDLKTPGIISGVLLVLALLLRNFLSIIMVIAAIVIAVLKYLSYKKFKPELDRLNQELADFDDEVDKNEEIIDKEQRAIQNINNKKSEYVLTDIQIEQEVNDALVDVALKKRYPYTLAVYAGGYLCGSDISLVEAEPSPIEWSEFHSSFMSMTTVTIDGVEYPCNESYAAGEFRKECTLFHLEPGEHTITVGSCIAMDPFSKEPVFTDAAHVYGITVTIDEHKPFAGVAIGVTMGVKADLTSDSALKLSANKLLVTDSYSKFIQTTGAKFPFMPSKDDYKEEFNEDTNEFEVLQNILGNDRGVPTKRLVIFTGHHDISDKEYSDKSAYFSWDQYFSSQMFNTYLTIDGCIYPLHFVNSTSIGGGKIPRQYYTFHIGAGEHAYNISTKLLLLPKILLAKEVISSQITTELYAFDNSKPEQDFTGIAVGFISTFHSDDRLVMSWIANESKWKMCVCDGVVMHDEHAFMEKVQL